jgi:hypothetical protein
MARKHLNVMLILLFLLIYFVGASYCSRHTQAFYVKAKSQHLHQNFLGSMPKAMSKPPSGPSREHNGIELHNSKEKP